MCGGALHAEPAQAREHGGGLQAASEVHSTDSGIGVGLVPRATWFSVSTVKRTPLVPLAFVDLRHPARA